MNKSPSKKWPADSVERRSIDGLIPYARNSRTHSDKQIAQIAGSMREWGWTNPVLVDEDGGIIAGHGRVLAARQLGLAEVPCMVADGWTEEQKRAYVIADNKLAENAGWDFDALKVELGELKDCDFDLGLIGFDDSELAGLLEKTEGNTDPDETPEVQENAITERGDVWLLGKHRLRCGDSTDADDVSALLNGVEPHLMVTDPPYGVEYDPAQARATSSDSARGKVLNDDIADWREAWSLFPGQIAYVWHAGLRAREVVESLEVCGFQMRAQIIWDKQRPVISRGHYHFQHEPCWYAVRKGSTASWSGDRKQSTVWAIDKPRKSETGHGTQKPVECMRRPIVNNSSPGQAVYEPFAGSGTTIIAGEMEGRHIYAMELDERYCDVIVRRWQDFTGQQATLEGDGRTFDEIKSQKEAA